MTVQNNSSLASTGIVTKMDVLNSASSPFIDYRTIRSLYGGDFISDLKLLGRNIFSGIQKALPIVSSVVGHVAPLIGLGGCEDCGEEGGALVGGRRMRKSSLKHRLMH